MRSAFGFLVTLVVLQVLVASDALAQSDSAAKEAKKQVATVPQKPDSAGATQEPPAPQPMHEGMVHVVSDCCHRSCCRPVSCCQSARHSCGDHGCGLSRGCCRQSCRSSCGHGCGSGHGCGHRSYVAPQSLCGYAFTCDAGFANELLIRRNTVAANLGSGDYPDSFSVWYRTRTSVLHAP